jgi:hypothetical protein
MSKAWEDPGEDSPRPGEVQIPNYKFSAGEERGDIGINPGENHRHDFRP